MKIKVLLITYNRPDYTELCLKHLFESVHNNVKYTIWDNGSSDQTIEVIKRYENHSFVERVILNRRNDKLRIPTNWFWENSQDADLIGKVDDDCLVPKNWLSVLEEAHEDIKEAGILACWHYLKEDFDYAKASKKIFNFGKHKVLRNCWVGGSGYLMKREVIKSVGYLKPKDTFTDLCLRASAKGFVVGWYYPFLYQEHMDDPRAPHTGFKSERDFEKIIPLSAQKFGIKTMKQWVEWLKADAHRLQEYSINPYDYIRFRSRLKRKFSRMLGKHYFPKA